MATENGSKSDANDLAEDLEALEIEPFNQPEPQPPPNPHPTYKQLALRRRRILELHEKSTEFTIKLPLDIDILEEAMQRARQANMKVTNSSEYASIYLMQQDLRSLEARLEMARGWLIGLEPMKKEVERWMENKRELDKGVEGWMMSGGPHMPPEPPPTRPQDLGRRASGFEGGSDVLYGKTT